MNKKYSLANKVLARYRNRVDSEHEQALIRVLIVGVVFLYLLGSSLADYRLSPIEQQVLIVNIIFLGFALLLIFAIGAKPEKSTVRRIIGIIGDNGVTTYAMFMMGNTGSVLYGVFLWITFGNGLRYGKKYLYICHIASLLGFGILLANSQYWNGNRVLGYGLFTTLLVLPIYVASLLQRLTDAIDKANEANKAKSRFLANMSHEMRTPLNGVIGMADLMMGTDINIEQRDYAQTIHASAHTLLTLINRTLDISKIEAGKLQIESTDLDLHNLISNIIRMLKTQAREKNISLYKQITPDTPYNLIGDPLHLRQVLINLISNAIKFTEHGHVLVKVNVVDNSNHKHKKTLRFEVTDTGIGIPESAQNRIFDSFTQADESTTRRYGGTGLGTTISKEIVEAMGGRIGVTSKDGQGTTFWFELEFKYIYEPEYIKSNQFLKGRRAFILTRNPEKMGNIIEYCSGWGMDISISQHTETLASTPVQAMNSDIQYHAVIIDESYIKGKLHEFSELLESNLTINSPSKILITSKESAASYESNFFNKFTCLLRHPTDKSLLFNALHAIIPEYDADNVSLISNPHINAEHQKHAENNTRKPACDILFADDNSTNQKVIGKILEKAGHTVDIVSNGQQALDALENYSYDLAILDMQMPEMDGIEALKTYQFITPHETRIPIIILSANATTDAMNISMEAGAKCYLTKPVETQLLLQTVNNISSNIDKNSLSGIRQSKGATPRANDLVINEDKLLQLKVLGNNNDFFSGLIEGFIDDTKQQLSKAEKLLTNHEYNQLQEVIHAVKGSAGSIGAEKLYNLCRIFNRENMTSLEKKGADMLRQLNIAFATTKESLHLFIKDIHRTAS